MVPCRMPLRSRAAISWEELRHFSPNTTTFQAIRCRLLVRRDATGFPEHRVRGRRIPAVGCRTEQQRELPAGAAAIHAIAVGVDAVLARVLTDEAYCPPHVRHDRGHGISRAAAVAHGE